MDEDRRVVITPRLPRPQEGPNPQHLIMTLLGDYWYGQDDPLPSSGLVAITAEFDISEPSTRMALNRLTRRGLLAVSKVGRRTYYGVHPQARATLGVNRDRFLAFLSGPSSEWGGTWTVVTFSVPEDQRDLRHALRSRLRGIGFEALYDGVWFSFRPETEPARRVLADLGVHQGTVLTAEVSYPGSGGPGHPLSAWDLDGARQAYEEFLAELYPVADRASAGRIEASEALLLRTSVMDTWRQFPAIDPDLPLGLLPADWPRARVRDLFVEVYEALGPLAELRIKQLLAPHAPELAAKVRYHSADASFPLTVGS